MTSAWTLKPVTFPIPPEIQVYFDKFKVNICLDKTIDEHIIHCYYQFVYLITIMFILNIATN